MPIMVGQGCIDGDVAREIARLESLLSALERIGNGEISANPEGICRRSAEELEAAPLLDPYTFGSRSLPCLIGCNAGRHPVLRGPVICTTEIWAMSPEQRWARTLSRLDRLQSYAFPTRNAGAFRGTHRVCGGEGEPMRLGERA